MMTNIPHAVRNLGPWILVLGFVFSLAASQSLAKTQSLFNKPVYHPESKSYYELVDMRGTYSRNWHHAHDYASKRVHKGARGRLAIVDSPEVHEFLRTTFKPNRQTWIGLRYWCAYGKSQWVDGSIVKRGDFTAWNHRWDMSGEQSGCHGTKGGYMPVFYTAYDRGFRWGAQGASKNWHYYIVQYPTGEE